MDPADAARINLALNELRLPAMKLMWPTLAATANKEGWPAARFLAALSEHEMAERQRRRIERHLDEARLPGGKTLDSFDFATVPMISKAHIMALAAGDAWLGKGANLLLFGGQNTFGRRHRIGVDRTWVARSLRANDRSRSKTSNRQTGAGSRKCYRQTR